MPGGAAVAVHVTDIRAPELAEVWLADSRPEVVFHLAAQVKVRPSVDDPVHDAEINVLGTLNVLGCGPPGRCPQGVFASSGGAVYGARARLPAKETAVEAPRSPVRDLQEDRRGLLPLVPGDPRPGVLAAAPSPTSTARARTPALEGGVVAIFAQAMLEGRRPTDLR